MPPLIALDHVRREFDGSRIIAIDDVSLSIGRGETVAIVGPSGSGKSTLLNLICGLDQPTRGDIRFDGVPVRGKAAWAAIRAKRIGIVFQSFCLINQLSARENIEVALLGGKGDAAVRREHAMALLRRVGLEARAGQRPPQLSGGERQRVAIARALANDPDLLVADEPTGSLDRKSGQSIMEIMAELQHRTGTALLVVTHDPAVAALCARQLEIIDGRIAHETTRPVAAPASLATAAP
jgi:putative ABC transport system ATP-binding protein